MAEASLQPPVSLPFHLPPFNSSFHPVPSLSLGSPESEFETQIWMQVIYLGFPSGSKETERAEGEKSKGVWDGAAECDGLAPTGSLLKLL